LLFHKDTYKPVIPEGKIVTLSHILAFNQVAKTKNEYILKLKAMAFMALFEKTMAWDYLVTFIKK
jgi:hypothetical protein